MKKISQQNLFYTSTVWKVIFYLKLRISFSRVLMRFWIHFELFKLLNDLYFFMVKIIWDSGEFFSNCLLLPRKNDLNLRKKKTEKTRHV